MISPLPLFAVALSQVAAPPPADPALRAFVREGVAAFHGRRLQRLETLDLDRVLARKNPYLLKAKNFATPDAIVRDLLDDHLSLQESTLFGAFLEQLAIHVCAAAYGGRKSAVEGIDLEFERGGTRYIVSVKSGPNWGNSSSIKKMEDHFRKAKRVLGTNAAAGERVVAVNGCCYGKVATEDRGDYLKLCGRNFWALISGDDAMYQRIAALIGEEGAAHGAEFEAGYRAKLERFTAQFRERYCDRDGEVLWSKLVELSSG